MGPLPLQVESFLIFRYFLFLFFLSGSLFGKDFFTFVCYVHTRTTIIDFEIEKNRDAKFTQQLFSSQKNLTAYCRKFVSEAINHL